MATSSENAVFMHSSYIHLLHHMCSPAARMNVLRALIEEVNGVWFAAGKSPSSAWFFTGDLREALQDV